MCCIAVEPTEELMEKAMNALSEETRAKFTAIETNREMSRNEKLVAIDEFVNSISDEEEQARASLVRNYLRSLVNMVQRMLEPRLGDLSPDARVVAEKIIALLNEGDTPTGELCSKANAILEETSPEIQQELQMADLRL